MYEKKTLLHFFPASAFTLCSARNPVPPPLVSYRYMAMIYPQRYDLCGNCIRSEGCFPLIFEKMVDTRYILLYVLLIDDL